MVDISERLEQLKLDQLDKPQDNELALELDRTTFGFVFGSRPKVKVTVIESAKAGFVERMGFDGQMWSCSTDGPNKLGAGSGTPTTTIYSFAPQADGGAAWEGQACKFFFDIGTEGSTETKHVNVGVLSACPLDEANKEKASKVYQTPQQRVLALSFPFEIEKQTFEVLFQRGLESDDPPQSEEENSTYVARNEGYLVPGGAVAESSQAAASEESQQEAVPTDAMLQELRTQDEALQEDEPAEALQDKRKRRRRRRQNATEDKEEQQEAAQESRPRVVLVFEVKDFSDTVDPVIVIIKVSSILDGCDECCTYKYQVNAVDNGIGAPESPFEAAS